MERGQQLEHLIDASLRKAEELLAIALIPGDDNYVKLASMQKDLVVSLLNTGVKVDENRFRKKSADALTGILAKVMEREQELAPLIDATPEKPTIN